MTRLDPRGFALFATISVIWGLTWIPLKIGVGSVPPFSFAATRGLAAGTILLLLARRGGTTLFLPRARVPRLLGIALFSYSFSYGLLFWGARTVDTGVTAVVSLALLPTSLLVFSTLLGEERPTWRKLLSTLVGIAGLSILYSADLREASGSLWSPGLAAIAVSTMTFALGAIASRELLRHHSPLVVAGWTQFTGAALLATAALWLESPADLRALGEPRVLGSWLVLVIFGSVIAYTSYLRLNHLWSPHLAGLYSFVSPVIAVVVGVRFMREEVTGAELGGMALMLSGALLALAPTGKQGPSDASG